MLDFLTQRFFGSKKTNPRGQSVKLTLEQFESRFLPNAGPLFAGFGGPALVGSADPAGQSHSETQTLTATLTGAAGTSGSATFTSNSAAGTNNLLVQVSGLTANTTYSVTSGTTTLGSITTNASGSGQLSVSNVSPALTAGQSLTVLDPSGATVLSGTLAATGCPSGSHPDASIPGTATGSLAGAATRISTDASTFVTDLLSGNASGALAALQDFEALLSTSPNFFQQEQVALMFIDQVLADLGGSSGS